MAMNTRKTDGILTGDTFSPDRSVLLVHAPQWNINQPPIGIGYLTGYLEPRGYAVVQRDLNIELYAELPSNLKRICEDTSNRDWIDIESFDSKIYPILCEYIEKWAESLVSCGPQVIGFTVLEANRNATFRLIDEIKRRDPGKTIVIGGPEVVRYDSGPVLAARENVDFVVPDEGEETLFELLECLVLGGDVAAVKGLIFKDRGVTVDTGQRSLVENLDDLPFPVYSGFPLKLYRERRIPVLGSRGCIFNCTFCSEKTFWKRYRHRTGENLFKEFKFHQARLGMNDFYLVDSLINGNIAELNRLCDFIIQDGLKITWGGKASIRTQMTPELLKKMYQAGCHYLDYGIESGSPKILKDMKKGFNIPLANRVLRDSTQAGIVVGVFMLVGFPTESEQDYQLSKDFLRAQKANIHHVIPGFGCGIPEGSDLFINQERYGVYWKEDGWHSDHLSPPVLRARVTDFRGYCSEIGLTVF